VILHLFLLILLAGPHGYDGANGTSMSLCDAGDLQTPVDNYTIAFDANATTSNQQQYNSNSPSLTPVSVSSVSPPLSVSPSVSVPVIPVVVPDIPDFSGDSSSFSANSSTFIGNLVESAVMVPEFDVPEPSFGTTTSLAAVSSNLPPSLPASLANNVPLVGVALSSSAASSSLLSSTPPSYQNSPSLLLSSSTPPYSASISDEQKKASEKEGLLRQQNEQLQQLQMRQQEQILLQQQQLQQLQMQAQQQQLQIVQQKAQLQNNSHQHPASSSSATGKSNAPDVKAESVASIMQRSHLTETQAMWAAQQWTPVYGENQYKPSEEEIMDAMGFAKQILSALQFEDVPAALVSMRKCYNTLSGYNS
jgi:hypothetical protein